ncbi:MAG TPA: hypothetical protein VL404_07310 [Candidatus Eisenbacteria bacterium]|jgi:hypothetical protein|nr:hypothetical protein [Candidatus Eisenbacteria bacterium]
MSNRGSKSFSAVLVALFALSLASSAWAAEGENGVSAFFRKLFNYPGKAVKGTASMTANTLNNTGEKVISKTGENTAAVLSGDLSKTPNIVGDAAVGSAQTVGQTASETVQVPVKSAQDETQQ